VKGLKLGVPKNYFFEHVIPEVESSVRAAIDVLGKAGAEIVEVTIPDIEYLLENFFSIVVPEAAAYHIRTFQEMPEAYNDDVRELLEQGNIVFATTYINAQRSRNAIRNGFRKAFDGIDALVVPGLPVTAPKVGQTAYDWGSWQEPIFRAHARFNCPFNLCGLPAATIPCGFANDGLPIGVQIAGRPFDEATVLRIADTYQRHTDWHLRHPDL
jgi:aspartyl-tRNA(Asn)/glutamyl-tRNA(Gln) amidotransferase subunit A